MRRTPAETASTGLDTRGSVVESLPSATRTHYAVGPEKKRSRVPTTPCRIPCRLKAWGLLIPYRGL